MAKNFKNLDSFFSYLNKSIKNSMKNVAKEAEKILYDYMKKEFYDVYEPSNYERSWELLDSITVGKPFAIKNGWGIQVYFDTDKIHPYQTKSGEWNKHMSLDGSTSYEGRSISEWLIEWIEYGQNSPVYSQDGIHMISYTKAELEFTKKHLNKMMDELAKKGIYTRF